jgi:tetratricopeptide (TPR) repeat protein
VKIISISIFSGDTGMKVLKKSTIYCKYLFAALLAFGCLSTVGCGKNDFNYYENKGVNAKNPDEQIKYFTMALEKLNYDKDTKENKARIYCNRGNAYARKKDYDRAIADYDTAIILPPKDAMPYYNRGLTYAMKKDYDRAIADYDAAIILNPKFAMAYYTRGNAYANKKDYDRAIMNYGAAIRVNPKYAKAYATRGSAYAMKKDYDRAIADYDTAIKLDPKIGYNGRGWAYLWIGEWEKAKQDFEKAIKLNGKVTSPYGNLGIYYWKAERNKKKVLECYEKSFQNGFDHWDALYDDTSDGHFISDLNQTPEFKALVKKYRKDSK